MTPIWTPCPTCGEPLAATDHDDGCPQLFDEMDEITEEEWEWLAEDVESGRFAEETEVVL